MRIIEEVIAFEVSELFTKENWMFLLILLSLRTSTSCWCQLEGVGWWKALLWGIAKDRWPHEMHFFIFVCVEPRSAGFRLFFDRVNVVTVQSRKRICPNWFVSPFVQTAETFCFLGTGVSLEGLDSSFPVYSSSFSICSWFEKLTLCVNASIVLFLLLCLPREQSLAVYHEIMFTAHNGKNP